MTGITNIFVSGHQFGRVNTTFQALDKFESCLDSYWKSLSKTKMDKVYGELFLANDRTDKLVADMKSLKDQVQQHAVLPGASITTT